MTDESKCLKCGAPLSPDAGEVKKRTQIILSVSMASRMIAAITGFFTSNASADPPQSESAIAMNRLVWLGPAGPSLTEKAEKKDCTWPSAG